MPLIIRKDKILSKAIGFGGKNIYLHFCCIHIQSGITESQGMYMLIITCSLFNNLKTPEQKEKIFKLLITQELIYK